MAEAVVEKKKRTWRALGLALRNRKTGFMLLFGFAAGLPYALLLGTLYAWLTEAEVDLETMGVFSLIGLFAVMHACFTLLDMGMSPTLNREMARFTAGAHTSVRPSTGSPRVCSGLM